MGCLISINNNRLKQRLLSDFDEDASTPVQCMLSIQKINMVCEHWKRILNDRDYDYLYKLVLVGDTLVGKSNIMRRYTDDTFTDKYIPTIGLDFQIRTERIDGRITMLQIWDTGGQERFKQITRSYYRSTRGILLIFDITNPKSFEMITAEYKEIVKTTSKQIKHRLLTMLIGSKCDLEQDRKVSIRQAKRLANTLGCIGYMEVSAKNNSNIKRCFRMLVGTIYDMDHFAFDPNRPWMYPCSE
eukprot:260072_1